MSKEEHGGYEEGDFTSILLGSTERYLEDVAKQYRNTVDMENTAEPEDRNEYMEKRPNGPSPISHELMREETEKMLSQMRRVKLKYMKLESEDGLSADQRQNYRQAMENLGEAIGYIYDAEEDADIDVPDTISAMKEEVEDFLAKR